MTHQDKSMSNKADLDFLLGGGEMGRRIREKDWSKTPLGPPSQWCQSLKTAVRIMLTSRQPMFVWWGKELINLYNDAYKAIVGGKHPGVLGQPAAQVWREIWHQVGPRAESAMLNNEGTYDEALLLIMERNGYPEETYYTFSYSPVPNDQGSTGGIICANTDYTQSIINERQLALLRELGTRTADARTIEQACTLSAICLETNPYDLPFAMIYLLDPEQPQVVLVGTAGIRQDHVVVPRVVALDSDSVWPFAAVIHSHRARVVTNLAPSFSELPRGVWDRDPHQGVAIPIAPSGQTGRAGVLIVGLNPFRLYDDNYQRFLELVAAQIAASITNAQAYEAERQRAEALAALDQDKTLFFTNISHEFRTPLTLMLGPLEEVLTHSTDVLPPLETEQLKMVQRNGLRLLKLVNTLLDFSRIQAGRIQATYEPTDLATFTTELASVFRSTIELVGMELLVNCPPLPALVYVDLQMWEKIVLNLLSNAFKFTFQGKITVSLQWLDDHVELAVQDTGIGIPADEIPHLFTRFHRVKGARGRTFEGSGIGLSLVQELVQLHGGKVNVTSVPEVGSCFTVSIPTGSIHLPQDQIRGPTEKTFTPLSASCYLEEARRWLSQPEQDYICTNSLAYVLLADDNADMRDYVKRLLSQQYEVEVVGDGLAALASIRKRVPELVVTDVMMPKLDGLGLLRELRADPNTRKIPLILLSARAGEEARLAGLEAGADDYLIKPFSARELLARVESTLKMAHLRAEVDTARGQLETILTDIEDQLFVLDRQWCYTFVNDHAVKIIGRPKAELLGKNIWELFPHLVGSEFYTQLHLAVANNTYVQFEHYHPEWYSWVENRVYPTAAGVSIFISDITNRKQAEATLRESEERYRILTEVSPQIIWMSGSDGGCIYCNRHWFDYSGLTVAKTLGEGWLSVVHPDDKPRLSDLWKQTIAVGGDYEIEVRLRCARDGTYHWHLLRGLPFRNELGQPVKWIGTAADINERKQVEAEREQQTHRLQKLAEASLLINSTLSLKERLQLITHLARDIIGTHQCVISVSLNQNWGEGIQTVSLSDKYEELTGLNCQTPPPLGMTQAEQSSMGGLLAASLTDSEGRNMGVIQLTDKSQGEFTSADKAILVQLAQMASSAITNAYLYEESQKANRIKDEFLAVLSHELRSPLNPILGWTRLLQTHEFDSNSVSKAIATIERNAKLQVQLIDDLLDVSRILQGKLNLNMVSVNLISVIEAAMETVHLAAEAKEIQLQTQLDTSVGEVLGDAGRLQQVMWNLLANAIKFTSEGGTVRVRLEGVEGQGQVTVTDTGQGINPDFLPHIFEYFRQADSATTRKFGGLGLGLAIVRHLVELHGGRVWAESPGIGQGATFTVRLPLIRKDNPIQNSTASALDTSPMTSVLRGRQILVVDDDADSCDFHKFVLEQSGASVMTVASAQEALQIVVESAPDIILSDIGMPEIDGYMLMRQIRALQAQQTKHTPIVALTAYAGELNEQQALSAGFQMHLAKPIDPDKLVKAIVSLLLN